MTNSRDLCRTVVTLMCAVCLLAHATLARGQEGNPEHWVGTWATAVVSQPATAGRSPIAPPPPVFANQTLRQVVHVSLGGERIRVVLSNTYGTLPLDVGSAQVARRAQDAAVEPGSNRQLTFGSHKETTIPAGAFVVSDPVDLEVPPLSDVVIDLYLPGDTAAVGSPLTTHSGANQTSCVSSPGDHTGITDLPVDSTTTAWFFLSRVDVVASNDIGAVVLFGDSITDGTGSTVDTNNRWPDHLARRLDGANMPMGVLNLGIAGNRVLSDGLGVNALARFDRDVLTQAGVTHVVVLEGINDVGLALNNIGLPRSEPRPTAEEIIFGHQQLIARAKSRGLTIYGATFLPFEGTSLAVIPNYWSAEGEATRRAVNDWIRTSGAYDGVVDFEAAVQNPDAPTRIRSRYDSGDGLHPGDVGYAAMAEAVDLDLLRVVVAEVAGAR